jgi:hypothetical protein
MNAAPYMASEIRINAFQKLHAEFKDILTHGKCRSCSCFYADVLNRILVKLKTHRKDESDPRLVAIEKDFERWVEDADDLKMHG